MRRREVGTRLGLWVGMGIALVVGVVPYDTLVKSASADEHAARAHDAKQAVVEARALVAVLEAQLRSSESNLKQAKELLARLEGNGDQSPKAALSKDATQRGDESRLVEGVWRIAGINGNAGGKFRQAPYDEYKIMTAGHYLWLSFDPKTGKVIRSGGGTYSVKDGKYTAKVECSNSADLRAVTGQEYSGSCKVEGKKWYHFGRMPNGAVFDEVWERAN